MLQEHYLSAHCSRSMFTMCSWSSVHLNLKVKHLSCRTVGPRFQILDTGPEHVYFAYWTVCISYGQLELFDMESCLVRLMVQDYIVLEHMVLDHKMRPKSQKSICLVNSGSQVLNIGWSTFFFFFFYWLSFMWYSLKIMSCQLILFSDLHHTFHELISVHKQHKCQVSSYLLLHAWPTIRSTSLCICHTLLYNIP